MRYLALVVALGLSAGTCCAQPNTEITSKIEQEKAVQSTVKAFVSQLNTAQEFTFSQQYVFGTREGYFNAVDWFKSWKGERGLGKIEVSDVTVDKVYGNSATVIVSYKIKPEIEREVVAPEKPPIKETVTLRSARSRFNQAETWQIVPPNEKLETWPKIKEGSPSWTDRINLIGAAAYELAQRDWKYSPEEDANISMKRLKGLVLAVLQFRQDYNEQYAFAPQHIQVALGPYMADNKAFFNPITGETYGFNNYLCGRSSDSVKQPDWTVMFYEGQDQKPLFRYDGKAAIAYADGHVKLITPAEADDLIWKF